MHISGGHKDKSVTHSGDCEVCPPNMCCSEKAHSEHKEKKKGGGGRTFHHMTSITPIQSSYCLSIVSQVVLRYFPLENRLRFRALDLIIQFHLFFLYGMTHAHTVGRS